MRERHGFELSGTIADDGQFDESKGVAIREFKQDTSISPGRTVRPGVEERRLASMKLRGDR